MAAGVSILSDLPFSMSGAHSGEISTEMETGRTNARVPTAKYTKMGETLRHVIPGHMQCSMTCGGKACKYENPSRWSDEEQAIKGLYSSWYVDNLLAMARPSTEIIEKYNIIEQFQRCGLKTVINLQRPGEHASCGNPVEQESGFTYRPETFMEAGIYYYNFGWKDYGVASLTTILDMVKVMSFAVQEGKMAVHCHAGLGRTGVLLACYLVFTSRMSADQAILFVRAKRPNSIQTRGQLLCVREFAQFLIPLRSIFSCAEPNTSAVTLSQYLTRQRHLLHGYEARQMKNVPKIIQLVCRLLIDIAANRQTVMEEEWLEIPDLTEEEMRGKAIPVPLCSSHSFGPAALHSRTPHDQPVPSDNELESSLLNIKTCKSPRFCDLSPQAVINSIQDPIKTKQNPGCPFFKKHLHKGCQSLSSDLSEQGGESHCVTTVPALLSTSRLVASEERLVIDVSAGEAERGDVSEAPFMALQFELSPESRRLLVAKALAMDLTVKYLTSKVSVWQTELNSREGAWERLCMERDPLVLSSLMWSWLEQLRDPVISSDDVKALSETNGNPASALNSLEKVAGQRLTLLCVLDCAAHLLPVPEDVETSFLNHTIKVFTKVSTDPASEKTESLYVALKAILTAILHELRDKATEENGGS
uniref:Protein tyrosine phosphatase domain-containing protein 1 n=1 Tax=Monopterus albus TaxID=43700 RepID=A0A3Q3Q928_MONAL